jgi:uncharacterized membrane protein YiaA
MKKTHYYQILGVPENATIGEIKEAFRRKAKAFHPDINKTEGAHEQFIDINEAYSYLVNLHTKGSGVAAGQPAQDEYYRQWIARERQNARARAAKRARMKFEEFQQSSVYKTTSMLSHLLDYFLMLLGVFIIIAAGFGLYSQGLYITDNGQEVLNIRGIFADIVITIAGVLFILLSWSNIKAFREKAREK